MIFRWENFSLLFRKIIVPLPHPSISAPDLLPQPAGSSSTLLPHPPTAAPSGDGV
jgi:hypothetical protein